MGPPKRRPRKVTRITHPMWPTHLLVLPPQVLGSCQAHPLPGPHSIGPASGARQGRGGKPWSISSSSCWSPAALASGNVLLSSERRRPDTGHLGPSPDPLVPNNSESNIQESFIPCSVNKSLHTQVDHQVSSQTPPPTPTPIDRHYETGPAHPPQCDLTHPELLTAPQATREAASLSRRALG